MKSSLSRSRSRAAILAMSVALVSSLIGTSMVFSAPEPQAAPATPATPAAQAPVIKPIDPAIVAKIRDEGLNRSQVMKHLDYLCNVIGPRLTASAGAKAANDWTRDQFAKFGLQNAKIEEWKPFNGKGWNLKAYSLEATSPTYINLLAVPKAWSPGFDQPIEGTLVHMNPQTQEELEAFRGKLKDQIVLVGAPRNVAAHFTPLATRQDEARLQQMATGEPVTAGGRGGAGRGGAGGRGGPATGPATAPGIARGGAGGAGGPPTTAPGGGRAGAAPGGRGGGAGAGLSTRAIALAAEEGAKLILEPSSPGDGGTIFAIYATVPAGTGGRAGGGRAWSPGTTFPAQMVLAVEDFNRLARAAMQGVQIKMKANIKVEENPPGPVYNTVGEIPGTDPVLKDQIVMCGAHLDSFHVGTGATDNGAGSACMMEAMRILSALDLKPRRTIRIALWTGEEEGLLGSRAYVAEHFGAGPQAPARGGRAGAPATGPAEAGAAQTAPARGAIARGPEFEKLSAYYNLDNGTGKIRGITAENNTGAMPYFREWLKPFNDLGAIAVNPATAGGTDHGSFDQAGLPGFNFMQDPIEYNTRTHHSTADVYDRIQPDDMKQAATIIAAFLWQTANIDERMPRKAGGAGGVGRRGE